MSPIDPTTNSTLNSIHVISASNRNFSTIAIHQWINWSFIRPTNRSFNIFSSSISFHHPFESTFYSTFQNCFRRSHFPMLDDTFFPCLNFFVRCGSIWFDGIYSSIPTHPCAYRIRIRIASNSPISVFFHSIELLFKTNFRFNVANNIKQNVERSEK